MLSKEPSIMSFKQINSNCLNVPIKKRIGMKQESIDGGSDCSTVVERKPSYRESVGSNPAFFSSLSSQLCILNSGPSKR